MAKTNVYFPFIAVNLYHSTFLRNADPDLNENSGVSSDLDQKIGLIGGFPSPYSPLSLRLCCPGGGGRNPIVKLNVLAIFREEKLNTEAEKLRKQLESADENERSATTLKVSISYHKLFTSSTINFSHFLT